MDIPIILEKIGKILSSADFSKTTFLVIFLFVLSTFLLLELIPKFIDKEKEIIKKLEGKWEYKIKYQR